MGYSQYWTRLPGANPDAFRALTRDCWRLFAACDQLGIDLAGPFGTDLPETTSERITFNGASPADYETFCWEADLKPDRCPSPSGRIFCFCKTAGRPYDAAVVATLLLAHQRYGDGVHLHSDGGAGELSLGLRLVRAVFPDRSFSLAPFLGDAST